MQDTLSLKDSGTSMMHVIYTFVCVRVLIKVEPSGEFFRT